MKYAWSEDKPNDFSGVRRDCQPHRGNLLLLLACACLIAGLPILFPLAPVAFGCSLALWITARRDMAQMRLGRKDPSGFHVTKNARYFASSSIFVSAFSCLLLGLFTAQITLLRTRY